VAFSINPTQAILGYSDPVQHHPERRDEMINAISRNAARLQILTYDIVTKNCFNDLPCFIKLIVIR
jgi:hypothetical protein